MSQKVQGDSDSQQVQMWEHPIKYVREKWINIPSSNLGDNSKAG